MIRRALLVAGIIALAGCTTGARGPALTVEAPLAERTFGAVDRLLAAVPGGLAPETTILITSVADLNLLTRSSSLGRLISEQAAERLIVRGYRVPEARLAEAMQMRPTGEFMLSRQLEDVRRAHNAQLVLTGTFSDNAGILYINLRLVRLADGLAIAAADFEVPPGLAGQS